MVPTTEYPSAKPQQSGLRLIQWLLTLAALVSPGYLLAQVPLLTGTVVEAGTGQAIPFATVELPARHLGVQAAADGTFALSLPPALSPTDSLRVASLGFAARVLPVPTAGPCRLALVPLAVPLAEVVVRPSTTKPVRLGPTAAGDKYGYGNGKLAGEGNTGWQVARKFADGPVGIIQSVRFYIRPNELFGQCGKAGIRAPFRVRLYAANGANGAPGTNLLTESVLTAATQVGWHEVDLTPFQLRTPAEGFFVAMEWLYTDAAFACERTFTIKATQETRVSYTYGQVLGGYIEDAPQATWNLKTGKEWQLFSITFPGRATSTGHQNAAIQALVQPD